MASLKTLMTEDDEPVTQRKLHNELERFRLTLETERLEKQARRNRYIQIILMILMIMTVYFLVLLRLLEWQLAK